MIDQDKMRALAAKLRRWNLNWMNDPVPQEAADAIDLLLAEVEAANRELELSKLRIMGSNAAVESITKLVEQLRAELEAAAVDKRDAERYRFLRHADLDELAAANWEDGQVYEGEALDAAIDAALAQRQGEGS